MNPDWQARYAKAVAAAEEAGRIARGYFPDYTAADFAHRVEWKADNSPVTVADREAETHLRAELLRSFPGDGFLGEEFGDQPGTTGFRWIIDPIDGTRCFVRGIPLWATLVGLEYRGEMIAGVAVEPVPGNTYRALRGDGAYDHQRIEPAWHPPEDPRQCLRLIQHRKDHIGHPSHRMGPCPEVRLQGAEQSS